METMLLEDAIRKGIVTVGYAKKGIIGHYIDYKPKKKTCILTPAQTGWVRKQSFKTSQIQLHWRLEQVDSKIFLIPDEPAHSIVLNGRVGLEYQVPTINYYASKLFSSSIANEVLAVNEEMYKSGVSHCSKSYILNSQNDGCEVHIADSIYGFHYKLYSYGAVNFICVGVRPAVSLKSNIHVVISEEGDGSKEKPWKILKNEKLYFEKLIKESEEWLEKLKKFVNEMK